MYVQRDSTGKIIGVYANQQDYATEQLADTDAGLVAFLAPLPAQNRSGFIADVKTALGGILGANTLMTAYPAFMPAVQNIEWSDVQTLILDAQAKNIITATQYAAIKTAASDNAIPITLP